MALFDPIPPYAICVRFRGVSQTSSYIAPVLPIILCAPKFLDGTMSLGEVMQAASAFTIVQAAFNWLVDNYPRLADWTASAVRVSSLMVSLDNLERAESGDGVGRIERGETHGTALRLCNLSVQLDDGTEVVKDAEVAIAPGERVLVAGDGGPRFWRVHSAVLSAKLSDDCRPLLFRFDNGLCGSPARVRPRSR